MNLYLDKKKATLYTNNSQKARVLTESWVLNEIYCPSCGDNIHEYNNNKPVADFYCNKCLEDYELKSKKGSMGKKVSSGAYSQMIKRLNSTQKPNFFFLGYMMDVWKVDNFFVIPKHFFVPKIIEKRKPLTENARRHGWIGSNILFSKIPKVGQIYYIENGKEIGKKEVLEKWQKTLFLKKVKRADSKGWIIDIMNCIDLLNKKTFTLTEIYKFESQLKLLHPENNNIQAKIRQQLQLLREKNYLTFTGKGTYKLS